MKKLLLLISIISATFASPIENIDFMIKTKSRNIELTRDYNKYQLETIKEVLIFVENFSYQEDFSTIYNNLKFDDKYLIIKALSENLDRFDKIIQKLGLYKTLFTYSDNIRIQEFQFNIYKLLLLDNNALFNKILLNSDIIDHHNTLFNPYNLLNVDKRYQYYIKKLFNNDISISYINILQFLTMNSQYKSELEILSFRQVYMDSLLKYMKVDNIVVVPITINSIFFDKADTTRSINANYSFYIEGSLAKIIKFLNKNTFSKKYSHDMLKTYFQNKGLSKLDKEFYLKNIKFNVNNIKILEEDFTYIEVRDGTTKKIYYSIKNFLNENGVKYLY